MSKSTGIIGRDDYLKAAQVFHWATKEHFVLWFTGSIERHRRTEVMLPRLVKKGRLTACRWGTHLVYAVPRLTRKEYYQTIPHGLACTEALVRFWRSDMNATIIAERFFKGFGSIPELGLLYPNGKFLLLEYCTKDNFDRTGLIRYKVNRYINNLPVIEEYFDATSLVLFVCDVPRERIEKFVEKENPEGPFYFSDYDSFKNLPIGKQLTEPIYIWGGDGKPIP